ncbi:hypothetical protein GCM10017667_46070 [Streptomyces filamentosus]|uniref:Uncharacterized protein n=1 Tax=Streptomyces filamentosus TaxID=67294 RepID=A0A919EQT0_STRFL|nr:hypothetical protein GCM10017667_46070 [Streptomyces filamentosus]
MREVSVTPGAGVRVTRVTRAVSGAAGRACARGADAADSTAAAARRERDLCCLGDLRCMGDLPSAESTDDDSGRTVGDRAVAESLTPGAERRKDRPAVPVPPPLSFAGGDPLI